MKEEKKNNNSAGFLSSQTARRDWHAEVNSSDVEKRVFLQQNDLNKKANKRLFDFIDGSWNVIRRPVLMLFILQVAVYTLIRFPLFRPMVQRVIDPLLLLVNLAVFGWLASESKLKYNKKLGPAILVAFSAGIFLGLLVAVFKFLWIREYWTIFNLVIEPVYTGLLAAGAGWIAYIFIKKR